MARLWRGADGEFGRVCLAEPALTLKKLSQLNDELQTLEAAGIRRLGPPPSTDPDDREGKYTGRALELKKMAKSLLLNFLELIGTMSINPAQGEAKLEDLKVLLINFHHVLNEYRPHQARESLILLMQDQLDRKRAETEAVRAATARARKVLADLAAVGSEGEDTVGELGVEGLSLAEADETAASKDDGWAQRKIIWDALEELA
jgi:mediator of RNA polymerase II transcription subunit 7